MQYERQISIYKLTPKIWRKFKPLLVQKGEEQRIEKRRKELADSIARETDLVRDFWDRCLQTYELSTREFLPTLSHVMESEPIWSTMIGAIIARMKPGPLEPDDKYEKHHDQLSGFVLRWQDETRSHYIGKVRRSPTGSLQPGSVDDILELATSAFECLDCPAKNSKTAPWQAGRALIGWRALNGHLPCPNRKWKDGIEFSEKGSEAASSLATLAGLEAQTALASSLDSLDYRFTCGNCQIAPTGYRGHRGHNVWTWRQCVYHFIQMNRIEDTVHQTPKWNRLSHEMATYFKRREMPVNTQDPSWCCLHCREGPGLEDTRSRIIQHLISGHNIQVPRADVDYKHTMRAPSSIPVAIGLSEHPTPAQYYCLRCEKPTSRLYAHRAIVPHLRDKHGISDAGEGREYVCIPLYDEHYP
ncbi:hypothetical protein BDN72DRAFT_847152 [Pluteus cervinus]|uniref:Uncharacterized protein n=1 Tax=Pluteus cervinus TaxID=181527 RepID=A0ACD3ADT8_9AGAR|nr:hypothetical protein BDN72DRAFT_847152 [Pluteus cervinus]